MKQARLVWGKGPINMGMAELDMRNTGGSGHKHSIKGLNVT